MKRLKKDLSYCIFTWDAGTDTLNITEGTDWQRAGALAYAYTEQYLDLAGLSQEEKSIFIEAATVQEGNNFEMVGPAGAKIWVYDLMTSIPMDIENWNFRFGVGMDGFNGGGLNFEHVIYGRWRLFANDTDFAGTTPLQVGGDNFGSGEPTASDRIYCYRIIIPSATTGSVIVPPARHLIIAKAIDEAEYQYIYRLKRSYDLQQTYDND